MPKLLGVLLTANSSHKEIAAQNINSPKKETTKTISTTAAIRAQLRKLFKSKGCKYKNRRWRIAFDQKALKELKAWAVANKYKLNKERSDKVAQIYTLDLSTTKAIALEVFLAKSKGELNEVIVFMYNPSEKLFTLSDED